MSDLIPLRWVGPLRDHSGYGSATRSYIDAIIKTQQINLTLDSVSFEKSHTTHGAIEEQCKQLLDKPGVPYKIQIVHLTPENYPSKIQQGKYNIGYTTWETDKLPSGWSDLCNRMNEIWVPSQWNKEVFINSGVTRPIEVVHHVVDSSLDKAVAPLAMGVQSSTFVFYSIFQWLQRKCPLSLLKAYLTEFKPNEDVCLALKTYRINTSSKEKNIIKDDIAALKKGLNLSDYPQVRFFGDLLSAEQMKGFHKRGDCFVLPHAAEGFGIPIAEAMLYGKPTIATGYGGPLEFMTKENSFMIDYQEAPVCNMIFPNYNGSMTWAEPSIQHLKQLMRYVFENQKEAKQIGEQAKKDIQKLFNKEKIGQQIVDRLRIITAKKL